MLKYIGIMLTILQNDLLTIESTFAHSKNAFPYRYVGTFCNASRKYVEHVETCRNCVVTKSILNELSKNIFLSLDNGLK